MQPVGTDHPVRVDVRVLAATNRDLEAEVLAGRYRADLLHRLDVLRLRVPALRDHPADVPALAGHFADRARRRLGTGPIRLAPEAQDALAARPWPGNVRELENVVSRAVLRAIGRAGSAARGEPLRIERADVEDGAPEARAVTDTAPTRAPLAADRSLREGVRDYQREAIQRALHGAQGNWAAAARALGMHRSNLHHLARRLGLR